MASKNHHEVEITPRAEKDLKAEILCLEQNPLLGHPLQGSLRGVRALEFNLKGGEAYRAVYTGVDRDRVCVVFLVGSRISTRSRSGDGRR